MSTVKEEAIKLRKNIDDLFEAGQDSMIDKTKIVEKTVTGIGTVRVNDVSEIPHEVSVKLSGEPQYDYLLEDVGVSYDKYYYYSPSFSAIEGRTYIITASQKYLDDYNYAYYGHIAEADWLANTDTAPNVTLPLQDEAVFNLQGETTIFIAPKTAEYRFYIHYEPSPAAEITLSVKGENARDFSGTEVIVSGKNLFNKNATKYSGAYADVLNGEDFVVTVKNANQYVSANFVIPNGDALVGKTLTVCGEWEVSGTNKGGLRVIWTSATNPNLALGNGGAFATISGIPSTQKVPEKPDGAGELCLFIYGNTEGTSAVGDTVTYKNIQVEIGKTATEYEEYFATEYTANADGMIKGIKSTSPTMAVQTDIENVEIALTYHKSWGMQTEYDRFWDNYQDYGNRTTYAYAFAGDGWVSTESLPPKYPIILGKGLTINLGIFKQFNTLSEERYDMTEICGLLDCSQATVLTEMFADSRVENVTLDLSNCTTATSMFNCGQRGGNIDKVYLKVTSKLVSAVLMFSCCRNLETLRFTEDSVINVALAFPESSLLSSETVDSIINALKDRAGQTSLKITFHTNVVARLTEEQMNKILAKNWQIG